MISGFDIAATLRHLRKKTRNGVSAAWVLWNGKPTVRRRIGDRMIDRSNSIGDFYQAYFSSSEKKRVVQVGANDGIMCDPLRRFLAPGKDRDIRAVLVEPIPFYFVRLNAIYADYPGIALVNAACGAEIGSAPLYFIEPCVADQMNGQGPANNWAHGQGSFDRRIVEYWIDRNRFRGESYIRNMDTYYASIRSIEVSVIRLADIELSREHCNLLIVIDVQGFELDVIRGIDWNHPPAYIVIEADMRNSDPIDQYLISKRYSYLCGKNDRVYMRR